MAAPSTLLTPTVQHSHGLDAVGRRALDILIQLAELVADALDVVEEFRELAGQLQVAVTQFSLASRTGSPPSWKVSGKK